MLALAAQVPAPAPAQSGTTYAFAHTEHGAMAWNIGRLERLEGRNAFNLARLHYFGALDAAAGRPFPFVIESIDIDCDSRRYTSKFRMFLKRGEDSEDQESLFLAANEPDEKSAAVRTGTEEYSVYQSACLHEDVQGYFIVQMPTVVDALTELVRFSQNHPVGADVVAGQDAPAPPAGETSEP
ncbi:MAG: hypothetical protein ACOH1E_04360 [Brevundimonas sp.]